jgi:hypothetical protein
MDSTCPPETMMPVFMGCFIIFISLIVMIITVIVYCKIFKKAGYHWALGLISLIPIGNLVLLLILAFGEWPIERQLRAGRQGGIMPPPSEGQPHQDFRGL